MEINMSLRQKDQTQKKSTQTRTAVAPGFRKIPACAPTNAVWRQVGIPAGAEGASPSKNHAYGLGERHALSVSSSGRFPPNRRRNCVICGESAGENESPDMSQRVASPCARRRRTQACNAGCGRETRRKINGQENGGKTAMSARFVSQLLNLRRVIVFKRIFTAFAAPRSCYCTFLV